MGWPHSQDYNEAIQTPVSCFSDPELRQGEVITNALGLPMPCSGNFADVYAVQCSTNKWAVKCFTREIAGLKERYREISSYLKQTPLPFMVDFTYLEQGIRISGQWFPILKMRWVEGFTLNAFVKDQVDKPQVLDVLSQIWVKLAAKLRGADIAHCDLQHGNVLLVPGSKASSLGVKLVDYDGMCVPALTLLKSAEAGHPNFQHPQRAREGIYSLEVDRFSHLVIYTALRSLIVGGHALWDKYDNGDNLLFRQQDFEAPNNSEVFAELSKLPDPLVKKLVVALSDAARKPLDQAPLLEDLAPRAVKPAAAEAIQVAPAPKRPRTEEGEESAESLFASATATSPTGKSLTSQHKNQTPILIGLAAVAVVGLVAVIAGAYWFASDNKAEKSEERAKVASSAPDNLPTAKKTTPPAPGPGPSPVPVPLPPPPPPVVQVPVPKAKTDMPDLPKNILNSIGMELVLIPQGKFMMGSLPVETGHQDHEGPRHEVEISQPFYMGAYEVTQAEYEKLLGSDANRSSFQKEKGGPQHPVDSLTWEEANHFCRVLSLLPAEKQMGCSYRLPTEAEWEYACRADTETMYFFSPEPAAPYAWNSASPEKRTHPVGQLKPNPWGLYDVNGNVWEWCSDYYDARYYTKDAVKDPQGPKTGDRRVLRGASWLDGAERCRAAFRSSCEPDRGYFIIGFRVVSAVPSKAR